MRYHRARRLPVVVATSALTICFAVGGVAGAGPSAAALGGRGGGAGVLGEARTLGEVAARRELRALERSFGGRVGAYVIHTGTGETFGYRSGERFPMLSTFKATACAAVLHKARTFDPGLMERVVRWTA